MTKDPTELPFQDVLDSLLDDSEIVKPIYLYRLSNLKPAELSQLESVWEQIPIQRRRDLFTDLETFAEADALLFFEKIGLLGLTDPDGEVRILAIQLLDVEESPHLCGPLLRITDLDEHPRVRAAAAAGLGKYLYMGETDSISELLFQRVEKTLLQLHQEDEDPLVGQATLESLGFSSRPEVIGMIEDALTSGDEDWQSSALVAMGRSANPNWRADVLEMLDHDSHLIRMEAVRAAGGLEIKEAGPILIDLLEEADPDLRATIIWSLSEIRSPGASETLQRLLEVTEIEEEIELLEDAMENLVHGSMFDDLVLFDFDEDDLENFREVNGKGGDSES